MIKNTGKVAACLSVLWAACSYSAPFIPASDDDILARESAPSTWNSGDRRRQRAGVATNPDDLQEAVSLARHYMELGRSQGDPRHYGRAQAVLAPWWALPDPPVEVLLLRATIRQNRHQFEGALRDLGQLLERQPSHPQAWLTQAVLLQVRGEYPLALASCVPLLRLASTLVATTCTSSVASLNGRARDSYHLLLQTVADSARAEAEERLWSLTVLAEIAVRLGWRTQAEGHFRQALSVNSRDQYLLAAYADFLLDLHRPGEVVALLEANDLPEVLLLRRVLAQQQLASTEFPTQAADLLARMAAAKRRGEQAHWAAEARVALQLLDEPAKALVLALRNWEQQQEPRDARLVLETALRAEQPQRAAPVLAWIEQVGLEDVRIAALAKRLQDSRG